MFCTAECRDQSLKRYHRYECPIMDQLLHSPKVHLTLRQFFVALSMFDGSIENLQQFLIENENRNMTIFDFDYKSRDAENDKNRLLAMRSLVKSSRIFSFERHEEILKNQPQIGAVYDQHKDFIQSFLLKQSQISDRNLQSVFSGSSKKSDDHDEDQLIRRIKQPIGIGSLLFGSLFNHSCSNNIIRCYHEGKVVYVVCQVIPKDGELFDSYK